MRAIGAVHRARDRDRRDREPRSILGRSGYVIAMRITDALERFHRRLSGHDWTLQMSFAPGPLRDVGICARCGAFRDQALRAAPDTGRAQERPATNTDE
jgi:hypothetical protein